MDGVLAMLGLAVGIVLIFVTIPMLPFSAGRKCQLCSKRVEPTETLCDECWVDSQW